MVEDEAVYSNSIIFCTLCTQSNKSATSKGCKSENFFATRRGLTSTSLCWLKKYFRKLTAAFYTKLFLKIYPH